MHPANHSTIDTLATPLNLGTTGLVLAGGAGRRMQSRDKGLIPWQGEPLVKHAVRSLRPLVSRLLISCNRNLSYYRDFADYVIADDREGYQGPLAGLEAASGQVSTPILLVLPCDMPGVSPAVFARLRDILAAGSRRGLDAAYLRSGGRGHYLCLALRREALTGLAVYLDSGQRSVRGWLATLDTQPVIMDLPQEALRNINQPDADC